MQLIADSGSTKANWRLINDDGSFSDLQTVGYNPYYLSMGDIINGIFSDLVAEIDLTTDEVDQVNFYGSGCSGKEMNKIVEDALQSIFQKANINVFSDILGAARATCFSNPGIVGILGTGSSSCFFDGNNIADRVPALGFLLGDEGSGSDLGRRLLRAYLYRELPDELKEKFEARYTSSSSDIIRNIYQDPTPNRTIARYSIYLKENISHPFIQHLVRASLSEYIDRTISKYDKVEEHLVHFVGSVAFHFSETLEEIMNSKRFNLGQIVQDPLDGLTKFHLS